MYNRWKLKAKQLSDLTGLCYLYISTLIYRAKKRPSNLHEISDFGIGEGVPLQSVLNATPAHRDRARPLPHGASDQNLVPEPPHEVEEGEQIQIGRWRARRLAASVQLIRAIIRCRQQLGCRWRSSGRRRRRQLRRRCGQTGGGR